MDIDDQISRRTFLTRTAVTLGAVPLGALSAAGAPEATAVSLREGASTAIEPHFVGFNQMMAGQVRPWEGPLLDALLRTEAASFRYPAGTVGSYFNWRTGRLDETLAPEDVMEWVRPMLPRKEGDYKPEHLAPAVRRAGIAAVFMLGMAIHDLDEQVELLRGAQTAGVPVRYLELGNEVIFEDAEPLLERKFPTAERYGEIATAWIAKLREAFPASRIAACGSFVASDRQSERRRTWNRRMMTTLRGQDAITFHLYVRDLLRSEVERAGLTEVAQQTAPTQAERAASTAAWTTDQAQRAIGIVSPLVAAAFEKTWMPPGVDIWVTEWNAGGAGAPADRWVGGLVSAALLDAFLARRVTLVNHHTMTGNNGVVGADGTLNATGLVLRAFARATTGMTRATKLEPEHAPTVVSGAGDRYPAVFGWRFSGEQGASRVLVANLSDAQLTLRAEALGSAQDPVVQIAGAPSARPSEISERSLALGDRLLLPAFSVTVVRPRTAA